MKKSIRTIMRSIGCIVLTTAIILSCACSRRTKGTRTSRDSKATKETTEETSDETDETDETTDETTDAGGKR